MVSVMAPRRPGSSPSAQPLQPRAKSTRPAARPAEGEDGGGGPEERTKQTNARAGRRPRAVSDGDHGCCFRAAGAPAAVANKETVTETGSLEAGDGWRG